MQVYKLFFRILNRHKSSLFLYIGIFMTITLILTLNCNKSGTNQYENESCKFAFFDYDQSDASKGVYQYLKENNQEIVIQADEKEVIQDELYARNIACAIRIPKGFEEAVLNGEAEELIEMDLIPGMIDNLTMQTQLNGYMQLLCAYAVSCSDIEEALEQASSTAALETDVRLNKENKGSFNSLMHNFFLECCYVFLAMMIVAVGPILLRFREKEIRARIRCSSYQFHRINRELFLGILTVGGGCCLLFFCLSFCFFKTEMFTFRGGFYLLNMCCMMIIALSITYLVSELINNVRAMDMIANIVGLGISFLCGIFVPMQFLGDTVIKIAHFLPGYWYALACQKIEYYAGGQDLKKIFTYMGMELLFAAAFICAGHVAASIQYKQQKTTS